MTISVVVSTLFLVAVGGSSPTVTPTLLLTVLSALGILGGIGLGVKAILERKTLNAKAVETQAKAGNEEATAASIVAAAARELIDPLRRELATERAESEADVARERGKVKLLQEELDNAFHGAADLRVALHNMSRELELAKSRIAKKDAQIVEYEKEIARFREARFLNEDGGLDSGPHST